MIWRLWEFPKKYVGWLALFSRDSIFLASFHTVEKKNVCTFILIWESERRTSVTDEICWLNSSDWLKQLPLVSCVYFRNVCKYSIKLFVVSNFFLSFLSIFGWIFYFLAHNEPSTNFSSSFFQMLLPNNPHTHLLIIDLCFSCPSHMQFSSVLSNQLTNSPRWRTGQKFIFRPFEAELCHPFVSSSSQYTQFIWKCVDECLARQKFNLVNNRGLVIQFSFISIEWKIEWITAKKKRVNYSPKS